MYAGTSAQHCHVTIRQENNIRPELAK